MQPRCCTHAALTAISWTRTGSSTKNWYHVAGETSFRKTHKVLYRYFKVLHCSWDRTWSPPALDPCAATACQQIPFPPKETGLVHLEDPDNPITLASEFTLYDVSLPLKMKFPGDFCGDEGRIMLVVGSIPSGGKNPLEIIFQGEGPKEAFHVLVDPGDKKETNHKDNLLFPRARVYPTLGSARKHHNRPNWGTWRGHHYWPGWAFLTQVTWSLQPVSVPSLFPTYITRIGCDADGWMVLPNKEPSYAHFFHVFSHTEIRNILVTGDAEIGYIGFGEKGERKLQSCFCRTFCHRRNRFIS